MNTTDKKFSKAQDREKQERPPLEPRLRKAYIILLQGIYHITRLNELAQKLNEEGDETANEVARAALVQGGACLDSAIKQMIRDCLRFVAELDPSVRKQLATRIGRSLKKDKDDRTLIELIVWRDIVIDDVLDDVITDLVSSSLQSMDELRKVQSLFGVKLSLSDDLSNALFARNQIVHEMDIITPFPKLKIDLINLIKGKKEGDYRRQRDVGELNKWAVELVETAHSLLRKIDDRIKELNGKKTANKTNFRVQRGPNPWEYP